MTIASELTKLNTNLGAAYTAVDSKGGTLPQAQNFDNLATAISSIPSSSTPTLITKNITQNGTYNASSDNADGYSSVTVNVSGGGGIGIPREVKNGVYQMPTTSFTFSLPSNVTDVGKHGLIYAFYGCTGLTTVDLSSLTSVGTNGLANAFRNCTGLTDIYFRALTTSSFGTYKNQFNNMMTATGTSKTHTLHFPSNMESTILGLTGYPLFGGTSGYVVLVYDLPATS